MKSTGIANQDTVALIEIGGSHDECLYTQLFALKSIDKRIILICTEEVKERNPHFEELVDEYFVTSFSQSEFKNFGVMRSVLKFMKSQKVSLAVLNTAQGVKVRNLCLLAQFSKIEFIGIIHTTRKLQGSFTQKIINWKVKKLLLLSEFLLKKGSPAKGIKLDYFYPIRFSNRELQRRQSDRIEITIIGGVENRRKDLEGFVKMIKGVNENVQFTFLGKSEGTNDDVIAFKKRIEEEKLNDRIKLFDHFVSQDEFVAQLEITDAILPLVHPETPSADQYFRNQISGAMSVSFGYKIPLLIHEGYQEIEEMKCASVYYNEENFADLVPSLKNQLSSIVDEMRVHSEYQAEYQEKRYLDFIFSD